MKRPFFCWVFLLVSLAGAAQVSKVDFTHLKAEIAIDPIRESVSGALLYTFDVLEATDSVSIDARQMEFEAVELNGKAVDFFSDGTRLWILDDFRESSANKLSFRYAASPAQALYFVGWDTHPGPSENEIYHPQVWTQGQGKNTSHWLPSFDDYNEKLEFDLTIDFRREFRVISNGALVGMRNVNDSINRWKFDMKAPMSSYLVAVAAGIYEEKEITTSGGTPISLYYYRGDLEYVEPTYRHTGKMFDFLEEEIGIEYPWQNYKQVPVRDFLYSGMENTGMTIFSDFFMTDSIGYRDRNYVMVNAHELAHQWFGNLVTAATPEDHWLQEGFATYYALLAEREVLGEDHYYWKLYESAEQLKEMSDQGRGEALLNSSAGSLTYYQKGAWALHILREEIGDVAFREGVRNYIKKYQYDNASTADLVREAEKASGQDLTDYVSRWLEQSAFPGTEALQSLRRSAFIKDYLEIAALKEVPIREKEELLGRALELPDDYIGQEAVHQLSLEEPLEAMDLYRKAFHTNNLLVRQAIALSLGQVPGELKMQYESLLSDGSYLTREAAFYNLWMNFPEDRVRYLETMEGIEGFYDKNIRILWLALNLATPHFNGEKQRDIHEELAGYTSPYYPFYIRQNAFRFLFQLNSFSNQNLKDLLEGTVHDVGRFRSFSREMLRDLLESDAYQDRFRQIKDNLPSAQEDFLERSLELQ